MGENDKKKEAFEKAKASFMGVEIKEKKKEKEG